MSTPKPSRRTIDSIRKAAADLLRRNGYEATTMRDLARAVGIEAASVYNHFPSKQALLAAIVIEETEDLLAEIRSAMDLADGDPIAELKAAVRTFVVFHKGRLAEGFIIDSERRALQGNEAKRMQALRDQLAELFKGIVARGARQGAFEVADADIAALAVLSICSRVAVWYRPDGRFSLEKVGKILSDISLKAVGARSRHR